MKLALLTGAAAFGIAAMMAHASDLGADNRLTVHEWGTFTVLQDEHGNSIGGVNTDDEPVPAFVHSIDPMLIKSQAQIPSIFEKGVPSCDPSITVRLETPVVYFHAPPDFGGTIDLDVRFQGGWLTQYYPDAVVTAPGLTDGQFKYNSLTSHTVGALAWHGLQLGTSGKAPQTNDPVWLSPRRVAASDIVARNGEGEKFIFYRGVGHVNTPVRVIRSPDGKRIAIRTEPVSTDAPPVNFGPAWLVDVRDDGKLAMRQTEIHSPNGTELDATFSPDQYSKDISKLRHSLHTALVAGGLFDDEAEGLLNTWEVSYFRRPGQRLFYLVPRQWTDATLPMQLSRDGHALAAKVDRVMVGRVELITPAKRLGLQKIATGPASNAQWLFDVYKDRANASGINAYRADAIEKVFEGGKIQADIQRKMPADYRAYLELGRFRNAVILDELTRHPTAPLKEFVKAYAISPQI